MFAIYYSMVDFFIHGVDLLGGYVRNNKDFCIQKATI